MSKDKEVMRAPADPVDQGELGSLQSPKSPNNDASPPPFPEHAGALVEKDEGELIDFKTLHWLQGGIVLVAETVSLGILSLPSVLATVGLVPGIILICTVSALATYSGLLLAEFRKQYPFVQNFGDAVELIGKPIGMGSVFREVFGWAQTILQIFLIGGHILMWTICMNTLTNGTTCTVVWAAVGMLVFWVFNVPRTLKWTSWMSAASVFITVIAVAIEKPIGNEAIDVFKSLGFSPAFLAVTNIAGAFSSLPSSRILMTGPKALAFLQITDTTLYIIAAVVIYVYVGPDVPSPALSAAGSATVRKAIWGVAIPTIAIAAVIYAHVASQYIFTRIFGNTKHVVRRTRLSTIWWLLITLSVWGLGMVIAESIPIFNNLLGLVSAAFASWFSFGLPGIFWLWMHYGNWFTNWKQRCRFAATSLLLVVGIVLCVLGLWVSIESIANGGAGSQPWTCESNAV
ncbi:aromatic and neutral aliphatic amino acid permease [Verticillium alfalfae VaMs.102]|uniref:Aromatic and neutral aliphatic amino acid permease n=1 Tax=Verticillium alfalfae (strain VaMs.102 / ATCC MYA-4576 / FGSC 10136) TaxID=526221 RepID=C9SKZ0_VERA1|nr:aromatic and neutral aliphatic amino acid permease [Verticillium alfalfae VaMs.102]EEY19358.1 aromatic and neutral aliphatic amino acid permease [Verticillium alfalfae VaMs.102]